MQYDNSMPIYMQVAEDIRNKIMKFAWEINSPQVGI